MSLPLPWYRASKKAWYLQVSRGVQKRLGRTKAEADAAYRQWLLDQGQSLPLAKRRRLTVAEVAQQFLDRVRAKRKPKTYEFYCYFVVPFVDRFGASPAAGFPPLTFEKWLDEHAGWKASRRNAIIAVSAMFGWAVKKRLLAEHPLLGIERPAKRKRRRILTAEEQAFLLSKVRDRQFREFCFALLATGARPMEVAAVEGSQVSRDGTTWVLTEHKTAGTGAARVIYLSPEMQELTRKLMAEHPAGPLFRSYRKNAGVRRPWTRNGIRCRFKRLREKHPELAGVTAYALRHSFATQALTNGVSPAVVAALLGHKSIRMLDEHYNHTDQATDALKEAARQARRGCA